MRNYLALLDKIKIGYGIKRGSYFVLLLTYPYGIPGFWYSHIAAWGVN